MKQSGHSVVLHVTGFLHYLYIAAPRGFLRSNCESYGTFLETRLGQNAPAIHSVEILNKENLFGFQGNTQAGYIKITVTDPKYISRLRSLLESPAHTANYKQLWKLGEKEGIETFDSIQYVLRFMIDTGVCEVHATPIPP